MPDEQLCVSLWRSKHQQCPYGRVFLGYITLPNNKHSVTLAANVLYSAMPVILCSFLLLYLMWVVTKRNGYRGGPFRQHLGLTWFLFALRYLFASLLAFTVSHAEKAIYKDPRPPTSCIPGCGMPDVMAMWSSTLMTNIFIDLVFKLSVPYLTVSFRGTPPVYTEEEIDRLGYTPIRSSSFVTHCVALLVLLGPIPTARIVLGDASFSAMAVGFAQGILIGLLVQVMFAFVFRRYGKILWEKLLIPMYTRGLFGTPHTRSVLVDADCTEEELTLLGEDRHGSDRSLVQGPIQRCAQRCSQLASKLPGLEFLDLRADAIVGNFDEQAKVLEERIREMLCAPPDTWKWRGGGSLEHQLVPAPEMESKIRDLFQKTVYPSGCPGSRGSSEWLAHIKSIKVSRLEHPELWTQYACTKMTMKQQFRTYKVNIPPLSPPLDGHETLDPSLNEVYLWHGTGPDHLEDMVRWGLDERVCSTSGLYGAGLYFACDICKSGTYAEPAGESGNIRYIFYARVLLGLPFYPSGPTQGSRRPPIYSEKNGQLYDSVVSNVNIHREFIVYDRRQVYPEFLIEVHV